VVREASTEDRWQRLVDEFHRQEAARAVVEDRQWGEGSLWRAYVLTLLLAFGGLLLVAFCWYGLERAIRNDPSRCETTTVERAEVGMGGWAEPDRCTYFDEHGEEILRDGTLAGPVTRSYGDVLADSAIEITVIATAGIAGATVAIARWWGR
jgi:hypothetical protein